MSDDLRWIDKTESVGDHPDIGDVSYANGAPPTTRVHPTGDHGKWVKIDTP